MVRKLLLDMDGVITDWVGAAHRLWEREHLLKNGWPYPPGKYNWYLDEPAWSDVLLRAFWESMTEDFWANQIEWDRFGRSRVRQAEAIFGSENIHIVTALPPCVRTDTTTAGAARGKWLWLRRELPQYAERVVFTQHKYLLAAPWYTLWDDSPVQVRMFREHGGCAVLIDQPWNNYG